MMNFLIVVTALAGILGYIFTYPDRFGICDIDTCSNVMIFGVGEPLLIGVLFLLPIFLLLRILPEAYFKTWLKFGVWYIPLAALWIIITPARGGHFLAPDKEALTWILGGIYVVVSLTVILFVMIFRKSFRRQK